MRRSKERGMTLAETLVATAICGVVMVALGALASASIAQSKNQGTSVSQATALAAQKIDQLMTMQFTSASTAAPLACATSPCGSLTTDTTNYVEYMDVNGLVLPSATSSTDQGVFFTRRWKITNSTTTTKMIEVYVAGQGIGTKTPPTCSMACIKAQQ